VYQSQVYPRCNGDPTCERLVDANLAQAMLVYAGSSEGLQTNISGLLYAINTSEGNYGYLALQVLEDAGPLLALTPLGASLRVARGAGETVLPGMTRPIRPVNPAFPPNSAVTEAMGSTRIQNMVGSSNADCSDIANALRNAAGGRGQILEVRPAQPGGLTLIENGVKKPDFYYHQVYTDGRYVYDPRLSSQPIPRGDWEQLIRRNNPGVTISNNLQGLR
jgi:hypothetical protein